MRNDLDLHRTGGPRPATVRRVLATEPSLRRVASFGPISADPGADGRLSATPGSAATEAFRGGADVYRVPAAARPLESYPGVGGARDQRRPGGPAAPPARAGRRARHGPLPSTAEPLAKGTDEGRTSIDVATDSARDRDVSFGSVHDDVTYTRPPRPGLPTTGEPPGTAGRQARARTGLTSGSYRSARPS